MCGEGLCRRYPPLTLQGACCRTVLVCLVPGSLDAGGRTVGLTAGQAGGCRAWVRALGVCVSLCVCLAFRLHLRTILPACLIGQCMHGQPCWLQLPLATALIELCLVGRRARWPAVCCGPMCMCLGPPEAETVLMCTKLACRRRRTEGSEHAQVPCMICWTQTPRSCCL
jgi:hypothetical protein